MYAHKAVGVVMQGDFIVSVSIGEEDRGGKDTHERENAKITSTLFACSNWVI